MERNEGEAEEELEWVLSARCYSFPSNHQCRSSNIRLDAKYNTENPVGDASSNCRTDKDPGRTLPLSMLSGSSETAPSGNLVGHTKSDADDGTHDAENLIGDATLIQKT